MKKISKRTATIRSVSFLLAGAIALGLTACADTSEKAPRQQVASKTTVVIGFGSVGNVVLTDRKLVASFPKLHDRRYSLILSRGTCSAPALSAGLIIISPRDWTLDRGLKATVWQPTMLRGGHLDLVGMNEPHNSRPIGWCADVPT
jgi:hypothetical protein